MRDMPRRKKDGASVTLTIRMTQEDRELLDRLVERRSLELSDEGLSVTATSVIRGMIRREARSAGLLPALGPPVALATPPPPSVRSPSPQTEHEPKKSRPQDEDGCGADAPFERRAGYGPLGIPTPLVPTGLSEPQELRPHARHVPASITTQASAYRIDVAALRDRAVRAIRARRFRQRDLVERADVPQQVVSRFLLGADTSEERLAAIASALEELDV